MPPVSMNDPTYHGRIELHDGPLGFFAIAAKDDDRA